MIGLNWEHKTGEINRMGNIIRKIIFAISIILVFVSGYHVFIISREYLQGAGEYESLEEYVSVEPQKIESGGWQKQPVEGEESQIPVCIEVDYDGLKSVNDDFVSWIYYEPAELSYPVVQGADNDFYIDYTFEKKENGAGAIFMDFRNAPDYSDYNTIIYGHNMKNGTMFAAVKDLLNQPDVVKENPYFYIFTENKSYMYEIFALYLTDANSQVYDLIEDEAAQKQNLAYIAKNANILTEKQLTASDKIVTLSTCYMPNGDSRVVLQGVLIAEEFR